MSILYVLQLEGGKYYVGKTDDVQKRFEQHKLGYFGSQWTKTNKPEKILETRQVISIHDENNVTKDLMKLYGVNNVRGGCYTQVDLLDYQHDCLLYELRCISDCCFKCGRSGHFITQCREPDEVIWECGKCKTEFITEADCEDHENNCNKSIPVCEKCGRNSHDKTKCFAKTHVNGSRLC
jgi:predicted GIY-YIG superfamily endonuclease